MNSAHDADYNGSHSSTQEQDPYGNDLLDHVCIDRIVCYNESQRDMAKLVFKTRDEKLERALVVTSHRHDP